jgi:predicted acylesterase/phospholipase RssA
MSGASHLDDLQSHDLYQEPTLICDLVMKGGITSGITYPGAVCEIAKTYRLRSIGGTSAGAIAAAAAAASEVGRAVPGSGFARLVRMPMRLAGKSPAAEGSVMFNLFQPSKDTEALFRVLVAVLKSKPSSSKKPQEAARPRGIASTTARLVRAVTHVVRAILLPIVGIAWKGALAGGALGAVTLVLLLVAGVGGFASWLGVLGTVTLVFLVLAAHVVLVVGALVGSAASLALGGLKVVPTNWFGLCSGYVPGEPFPPGTKGEDDLQMVDGRPAPKPLTTYLADELDALAGNTNPARPLTLKDLADHGVALKMFTTNLTEGTPYTLPFRDRTYFFKPKEFQHFFPPRIVDWMGSDDVVPKPRNEKERKAFAAMAAVGALPFPDPENVPVVVMTRLSLSFPMLMSAVPLWAMRWTPEANHVQPTSCWFSDGGITSNFPIHFFDSALPRWPTFGINLGPQESLDSDDQRRNIWSPKTNAGGIGARWGQIRTVPEFAHAVADTMQNWMDNAQTHVPGYRDRIVVIKHTKQEGGMNLTMDEAAIASFSERGRFAGELLVNRFSGLTSTNPDDKLSWQNHRWVRYRALMPLVESLLIGVPTGYDWPAPSGKPLGDLIREPLAEPKSYKWRSEAQQHRAEFLTDQLLDLTRRWGNLPDPVPAKVPDVDLSFVSEDTWEQDRPFLLRAPRPRPSIRIVRDF